MQQFFKLAKCTRVFRANIPLRFELRVRQWWGFRESEIWEEENWCAQLDSYENWLKEL